MQGGCHTLWGYKRSLESRPRSVRFKFFLSLSHHLSKQASIQTIIQIMNILNVFVLFAILLKCVAASEDTLGVAFKEAVDGGRLWVVEGKLEEMEGA